MGPPEYKALETTLGLLEQDYDVFEDMAASKGLMLHVLGTRGILPSFVHQILLILVV